jgi:hypothetical protein
MKGCSSFEMILVGAIENDCRALCLLKSAEAKLGRKIGAKFRLSVSEHLANSSISL